MSRWFGRVSLLKYFDAVLLITRVANGSTAFAFVRYNNTKSPTQAILEEVLDSLVVPDYFAD